MTTAATAEQNANLLLGFTQTAAAMRSDMVPLSPLRLTAHATTHRRGVETLSRDQPRSESTASVLAARDEQAGADGHDREPAGATDELEPPRGAREPRAK